MNAETTVEITVYASVKDNIGSVARTVWPTFVNRTTTHKEGPKAGKLICGALFSGTRAQKNVLTRTCYLLDIETNKATGEVPPDADQVRAAMQQRGWAGVIYSTHSHTQEAPRYRVALPPETVIDINRCPAALAEDADRALGLAAALGLGGVVDGTKLSAESMFYLPTHAPDAPHFGVAIEGRAITAEELAEALAAGKRLRADEDQYQAAAQEQRPARSDSVIAAYNASATVAELLERHGYKRRPRSTVDWRSRYQTSEDSFATRVIDARWVTLSASDIAAGIGRRSASGMAASGDAFDLYCHYEHRGDQRAAMRAAAKALGLDARKPGDDWADTGAPDDGTGKPKPSLLHIRRIDAFAAEYEPASYLIDYMLQSGFLYSLTAETGAGKTALMILVSALVATGKPFGAAEVKKGSVIYCVGENADEFRQRMICLRENSFEPAEYDGIHVLTPQSYKGLLTPAGAAEVAAYAERIGGVDLLVVDTAAAFFDGDEENSNTELGEYARRLRRLCTLLGKPCVVVCSHPTKNAKAHEELVPRGGGAFVAEVDGNLTLMKRDVGASEMFWSKKFRGRIDNPVQIALTPVEAQRTKDAKGRPLRSVLAGVVEAEPVDPKAEQGLRDRIMTLTLDGKTRTVTDVAIGVHEMRAGETGGNGHPGWKRTNVEMGKLRKFKKPLLEETDKRWRITTAGKTHANGLRGGPDAKPVTDDADVF